MRKWLKLSLITLGLMAVWALVPSVADALIAGSDHDFSTTGWAQGQICLPCHTPHFADTTVADAPLWNHALTSATYSVYSSGTLNATDVGQPDGISKLCLSCHDGSVALDSYGTNAGSIFIDTGHNIGEASVGTGDLSNDHPISFTYNTALATADGELQDPATAPALGGTISSEMLFGAGNDQLECASCHDVHNTDVATDPLLRITSASSAICLTCHNK